MQHVCQITFCQQIGKNKKHNQDALFNGETVFQFKLKTAEKRLENHRTLSLALPMVFPIAITRKKPVSVSCRRCKRFRH